MGALVFDIKEGDLDGTDLSGTTVGLYNHFPSNLTSGNWTVGLVIDAASDDQARALEGIFRGDEGGPFGEFAGLISTVAGVERGKITVKGGDQPSVSIEGKTEFSFEPFTGPTDRPRQSATRCSASHRRTRSARGRDTRKRSG